MVVYFCGWWLIQIYMNSDQCDDHLALASAAQNVLIADAFFSSAIEEGMRPESILMYFFKSKKFSMLGYMKPEGALEWVSILCKFECQMQSGELTSFSPETQEVYFCSNWLPVLTVKVFFYDPSPWFCQSTRQSSTFIALTQRLWDWYLWHYMRYKIMNSVSPVFLKVFPLQCHQFAF